jgi:hypothetical protein
MSDNAYGTGFARRIREWDDAAEEEEGEFGERLKPFDGGIMLALATFFAAWDEENGSPEDLAMAVEGLRETIEAVIE